MSSPFSAASGADALERRNQAKIRNRVISIITLLLLIITLLSFLVTYSGFHDWRRIDTNLTIFVAVNVNIVLLATVFYMLLRNLFKLVYERKKPFAGVRLKTKLIIAFVALSLPSTAFHLMASGFMAFLFERWSQGEYSQVLDSAQVVASELGSLEDQRLRARMEDVLGYLPRERAAYNQPGWLNGYHPRFDGGLFIYDGEEQVVAQWTSNETVEAMWTPPSEERFAEKDGATWNERRQDQTLRRLLLPLPNSPAPLKVELVSMAPQPVSAALSVLNQKQDNSRILRRELAPLVLTFLVMMTLLIIFAATWIAFYLARGFVTPIDRLDDATHRVSEGELGYQVDMRGMGALESDFAGLVNSFNAMSRQLKEQRMQLLRSAEELRISHHELGERNRLVEMLLENIDAGIVSLTQQGNITALNRAAKRMLQPRVENWQGRHYRVVLDRELVSVLDELQERMRTSSNRQLTQNLTLTINRKPTIIEVTLLALENRSGQAEGTVMMVKDVTSIQRNQRALAWREVARRVAHEIKNPLTPIQVQAERIRRRYMDKVGDDSEVLDQSTLTIINEVVSLKKMVNEFSQFAKLPESKPVPDDINGVIEEVARFYRNGLPDGVRIDLQLDKRVPQFPLDREQMKRAFTNLIDNAIDSLNGHGTITLRTGYDGEAGLATVDVMDDGHGVPDHVRSRMFEPYTSTKTGGTGLGLTIVNQIVSDHNGYIRYSDRKPRGTIFSIELRLR